MGKIFALTESILKQAGIFYDIRDSDEDYEGFDIEFTFERFHMTTIILIDRNDNEYIILSHSKYRVPSDKRAQTLSLFNKMNFQTCYGRIVLAPDDGTIWFVHPYSCYGLRPTKKSIRHNLSAAIEDSKTRTLRVMDMTLSERFGIGLLEAAHTPREDN